MATMASLDSLVYSQSQVALGAPSEPATQEGSETDTASESTTPLVVFRGARFPLAAPVPGTFHPTASASPSPVLSSHRSSPEPSDRLWAGSGSDREDPAGDGEGGGSDEEIVLVPASPISCGQKRFRDGSLTHVSETPPKRQRAASRAASSGSSGYESSGSNSSYDSEATRLSGASDSESDAETAAEAEAGAKGEAGAAATEEKETFRLTWTFQSPAQCGPASPLLYRVTIFSSRRDVKRVVHEGQTEADVFVLCRQHGLAVEKRFLHHGQKWLGRLHNGNEDRMQEDRREHERECADKFMHVLETESELRELKQRVQAQRRELAALATSRAECLTFAQLQRYTAISNGCL